MSDDKPALVVGVADWHTNSTVGLNPASFRRESGSRHRAGKVSKDILRRWRSFWKVIAEKKALWDATVHTFMVGDLGDLNKHSALQLITKNRTEIKAAMAEIADLPAQVSDYMFIVRGTEAHSGGNGELEEWLAQDLDNAVWCSEEQASWWVANAEIGGKHFQVAHHPPTSSQRPHTLQQAVARAATIIAGRYMATGLERKRPDICIWAHHHTIGAQAYGDGGVWGIFLPPWQLRTSFAYRIGMSTDTMKIGGIWMIVKDGRVLEWDWVRWHLKEDRIWKAP